MESFSSPVSSFSAPTPSIPSTPIAPSMSFEPTVTAVTHHYHAPEPIVSHNYSTYDTHNNHHSYHYESHSNHNTNSSFNVTNSYSSDFNSNYQPQSLTSFSENFSSLSQAFETANLTQPYDLLNENSFGTAFDSFSTLDTFESSLNQNLDVIESSNYSPLDNLFDQSIDADSGTALDTFNEMNDLKGGEESALNESTWNEANETPDNLVEDNTWQETSGLGEQMDTLESAVNDDIQDEGLADTGWEETLQDEANWESTPNEPINDLFTELNENLEQEAPDLGEQMETSDLAIDDEMREETSPDTGWEETLQEETLQDELASESIPEEPVDNLLTEFTESLESEAPGLGEQMEAADSAIDDGARNDAPADKGWGEPSGMDEPNWESTPNETGEAADVPNESLESEAPGLGEQIETADSAIDNGARNDAPTDKGWEEPSGMDEPNWESTPNETGEAADMPNESLESEAPGLGEQIETADSAIDNGARNDAPTDKGWGEPSGMDEANWESTPNETGEAADMPNESLESEAPGLGEQIETADSAIDDGARNDAPTDKGWEEPSGMDEANWESTPNETGEAADVPNESLESEAPGLGEQMETADSAIDDGARNDAPTDKGWGEPSGLDEANWESTPNETWEAADVPNESLESEAPGLGEQMDTPESAVYDEPREEAPIDKDLAEASTLGDANPEATPHETVDDSNSQLANTSPQFTEGLEQDSANLGEQVNTAESAIDDAPAEESPTNSLEANSLAESNGNEMPPEPDLIANESLEQSTPNFSEQSEPPETLPTESPTEYPSDNMVAETSHAEANANELSSQSDTQLNNNQEQTIPSSHESVESANSAQQEEKNLDKDVINHKELNEPHDALVEKEVDKINKESLVNTESTLQENGQNNHGNNTNSFTPPAEAITQDIKQAAEIAEPPQTYSASTSTYTSVLKSLPRSLPSARGRGKGINQRAPHWASSGLKNPWTVSLGLNQLQINNAYSGTITDAAFTRPELDSYDQAVDEKTMVEQNESIISQVSNAYEQKLEPVMKAAIQTGKDLLSTVSDMWPSNLITLTRATLEGSDMQQIDRELGVEPKEHTGNILIDYPNQKR